VESIRAQAKEKEIQTVRNRLTKVRNSIRSKKSQLEDAKAVSLSVNDYTIQNFSVGVNENNQLEKVDINGEEVAKGRIKKIQKAVTTYIKKKEKFSDPEIIPQIEREIQELADEEIQLEAKLNSY